MGGCVVTKATGGAVTDVGGWRYHTFTEDGTFEVTEAGDVEYLIVGGGGGGTPAGSGGVDRDVPGVLI